MIKVIYNNRFLPLKGYAGIALYPFIFIRGDKVSFKVLNHEKIHCVQQKELYLVGFYTWYVIEFILRFIQYRDWDQAYRNISFEREAYSNEKNLVYLKHRKKFNFLSYVFQK